MPTLEILAAEEIAAVEQRIRPYVRLTPTIDLDGVTLKLEYMQHAGSFKTRGAFTNLLTRTIPAAGVAAASGGNHGAAVANAAKTLGVACSIFVPTVSSQVKVDRIRSFGATLHIVGENYSDSRVHCEEYVHESGALGVEAFDSRETLLGQATLGLELEQQAQLDTVLVAVGGGGLIGGIASWYAGRVKIVAVEPEGAPTLRDAFAAGKPVDAPTGSIAADSLAPRRIGELVFPIAKRYVSEVVLVSDDDIRDAQRTLWDRARIVAEPGGATAYAALLSKKYVPKTGERVGVVVSGGNTVVSWT
jgi:threonine dehydratase